MTLENIRFFEHQVDAIDKAIARELAALPSAQVLLSVPGLGPVFVAGIIAEVQDVNRFDTDAQLARFASIVWKKSQSGEFSADETPVMRSGNQYLRYYLIEAANSLRMHNEEYAAYYQIKYRESTTHHHNRACVLTAPREKANLLARPQAHQNKGLTLHPESVQPLEFRLELGRERLDGRHLAVLADSELNLDLLPKLGLVMLADERIEVEVL